MKLNYRRIIGLVVGGISILTYFTFYTACNYSRLLKTGTKATGRIISIAETGMYINEQPMCKIVLQVEIPGRPAYITTTQSVISYFQVFQFQPGAQVPIMVDPKDTMKVVLIRQGDMPQNTNPLTTQQVDSISAKVNEIHIENERITAIGIYSKAIVTKYTDMGITVNGPNPLVTLEVMVMPDNEPAFSATLIACLLPTSVPKYQPGGEIFVKYDPNDKTKAVAVAKQ